jgi:hypothetical protein
MVLYTLNPELPLGQSQFGRSCLSDFHVKGIVVKEKMDNASFPASQVFSTSSMPSSFTNSGIKQTFTSPTQ